MLNVVHYSFVPNTASTNRLISYLVNVPKEIKCRVFFIMPDEYNSMWENDLENIQVVYCWKKFPANFKLWKIVTFILSLNFIKNSLSVGDVVYVYDTISVVEYIRKSGIKYYGEKTEHPAVTSPVSRLVKQNMRQHFNSINKLDGLFVISNALKEFYVSSGVEREKVHVINMTVDTTRFDNIKRQPQSEKYIAYCGTVSKGKDGVDKLLKAFAIVARKVQEIKLYIIGAIPSCEERQEFSEFVKRCDLTERVVFTGIVSAKEITQMIKNAELLALARPANVQAKYGFPTKLGEYLLSGIPVVLTKVGDIPLFLEDEVSALISSPDSDDEFAEKIVWALNNKEKADIIGKKGADVAMTHFNAKIETKKLLEVMLGN